MMPNVDHEVVLAGHWQVRRALGGYLMVPVF